MDNTVSFLLIITLKFHAKYMSLGASFLKGNRMIWCKDRYTLLLKCLMTFLRYIRMIGRASGSIYNPDMVNTMSLLPKIALKSHTYIWPFGHLLQQEKGCYAARRDTHCCLSDAGPSLDVWRWLDELMTASKSPSWSPACQFYWQQLSNVM